MQALRKMALALPDTEEGIACKGTSLECITVTVKKKAFLFLGKTTIRLKLGDSLKEATKLAAKEPTRYEVGANGWTKVNYTADDPLPVEVLSRWVQESYRFVAPKSKAQAMSSKGKSTKKKSPRPIRKS